MGRLLNVKNKLQDLLGNGLVGLQLVDKLIEGCIEEQDPYKLAKAKSHLNSSIVKINKALEEVRTS